MDGKFPIEIAGGILKQIVKSIIIKTGSEIFQGSVFFTSESGIIVF